MLDGVKILNNAERENFEINATTGLFDKQVFVDTLVREGKWDELAYILSNPQWREAYGAEIGNIAILLPPEFEVVLLEEARYLATLEFNTELSRLEKIESEASGKVEEVVQDREVAIASADEVVKVGFEENPKIKELKSQIVERREEKKAQIKRLQEGNKAWSDNFFKNLNANAQIAKVKIVDTERQIEEVSNGVILGFGVDEKKLKRLKVTLAEQKKNLSSLREVQKKLSPINSEINKLRKERDELIQADKAQLQVLEARAEEMRKVAAIEHGGTVGVASAQLKSASENKVNFADAKEEYIATHSADIIKNSTGATKEMQKSLEHQYIIGNYAAVVTYLYEGAGKSDAELKSAALQAAVRDGKLNDMTAAVSKLSDEAKLSFVSGLIAIDQVGGLKARMDMLDIPPDKREVLGGELLNKKMFRHAFQAMGIDTAVKYMYEGDGKVKGLSDDFMKVASGEELNQATKQVALLSEGIKSTFINQMITNGHNRGLKARLDALGIDEEKQLVIAEARIKLGDFGSAYDIMKGFGKLKEFEKAAGDGISKSAEVEIGPSAAKAEIGPSDKLMAYANSFQNKTEGYESAGRILAGSIMTTVNTRPKKSAPEDSTPENSANEKMIVKLREVIEEIKSGEITSWNGYDIKEAEAQIKRMQESQSSEASNKFDDAFRNYAEENPILRDIDHKKNTSLTSEDKINIASMLCNTLKEIEKSELEQPVKDRIKKELNDIYKAKCQQEGEHKFGAIINKYSEKDNAIYNALKVATYESHHDKKLKLKDNIGDVMLYAPNLDSFGKTRDALHKLASKDMTQDLTDLSIVDMLLVVFAPIIALFNEMPKPEEFMDVAAHASGLKPRLAPEVKGKLNEEKLGNMEAAISVSGRNY